MADRQIVVNIVGDAKGFSAAIDQALGKTRMLSSAVQGLGVGIGIGIFETITDAIGQLTRIIPDLIGQGLAFADTVDQIMDATGASAEAASRFAGTLTFLGIPVDAVASKLGVLTSNIIAQEATLNRLGISIRSADGNFLDQLTIIDRVRNVLSTLDDGVEKTRLTMLLFGRSGQEMLDWLSLTPGQVALINDEMDRLGITLDENGVMKAQALSREFNLLGLASSGLANMLLNAVAPALLGFVSSLATWVSENSANIARFMANVVNFVLGLISALTGAQFQTVTFTDKLAALGTTTTKANNAIENATKSTKKAADTSAAAARRYQAEINTLNKKLSALRALDQEQERAFRNEMRRLSARLNAELNALDSADDEMRLNEQRLSLANQLADAQRELADAQNDMGFAQWTGDLQAYNAAQERARDAAARIAELTQAQADLESGAVIDARREQVRAIQDFIDQQLEDEESAGNKKKFIEEKKRLVSQLNSERAAAQAAGDMQTVADIDLKLQAVRTAIHRAQEEARNQASEAAIERQKTHLQSLLEKARTVGTGIGSSIAGGAATAAGALKDLPGQVAPALTNVGGLIGGVKTKLDEAWLAGVRFGRDVKRAFDVVAGAVQTVVGWFTTLAGILGGGGPMTPASGGFITNDQQKKFEDWLLKFIKENGHPPTQSQINAEFKALGVPGFHSGGIVPGRPGTEMVAMLQAGERVIPRTGAGAPSVVVNIGTFIGSGRDVDRLVDLISQRIRLTSTGA